MRQTMTQNMALYGERRSSVASNTPPGRTPPGWNERLDRLLLRHWRAMRGVSAIVADFALMGFRPGDLLARLEFLLGDPDHLDPVARAEALLAGHAVSDTSTPGGWRLDGRAVRLIDIMLAANKIAEALRVAPVKHPGVDA